MPASPAPEHIDLDAGSGSATATWARRWVADRGGLRITKRWDGESLPCELSRISVGDVLTHADGKRLTDPISPTSRGQPSISLRMART